MLADFPRLQTRLDERRTYLQLETDPRQQAGGIRPKCALKEMSDLRTKILRKKQVRDEEKQDDEDTRKKLENTTKNRRTFIDATLNVQ